MNSMNFRIWQLYIRKQVIKAELPGPSDIKSAFRINYVLLSHVLEAKRLLC